MNVVVLALLISLAASLAHAQPKFVKPGDDRTEGFRKAVPCQNILNRYEICPEQSNYALEDYDLGILATYRLDDRFEAAVWSIRELEAFDKRLAPTEQRALFLDQLLNQGPRGPRILETLLEEREFDQKLIGVVAVVLASDGTRFVTRAQFSFAELGYAFLETTERIQTQEPISAMSDDHAKWHASFMEDVTVIIPAKFN